MTAFRIRIVANTLRPTTSVSVVGEGGGVSVTAVVHVFDSTHLYDENEILLLLFYQEVDQRGHGKSCTKRFGLSSM